MRTLTDIQIRFADVDMLQHVNNVNLQHYFDLGKSHFFREAFGMHSVWSREGIITAAVSTSYMAQTRMEEKIYVETRIEKTGNKSLTLSQKIISRETEEVKAESRSVMVAFDFEKQESIPVPELWKIKLKE